MSRHLTLPFAREWHILRPSVFRYLEQRYVDEFFETGRLRLNTVAGFWTHPDEQRGDSKEGHNVLDGRNEHMEIMAKTTHGMKEYILSTCTVYDTDLMKAFGYDACFCITDTTNFAMSIATALARFRFGVEGQCIYSDQRIVERSLGQMKHTDLLVDQNQRTVDMNKLAEVIKNIGGFDVLFLKEAQFRHQSEYRFIWTVGYDVSDPIIVECPEARQHCERWPFPRPTS